MGDRWGIIDTTGRLPRIDTRALATVLTGTVLWGWYVGFVETLRGIGLGVSNGLTDAALWLSGDGGLISSLFGIASAVLGEAAAQNAAFIAQFGPLASTAAFVQAVVVVGLVTLTLATVARWLVRGVLP